MSPKQRLALIAAGALLLVVAVCVERFCNLPTWQLLLVYLVPYLTVGLGTIKEAIEGLAHREALNEDFLMAIATIGALGIGFFPDAEPQFAEAVFVMLFFQVGEMFEGLAEDRSRASITQLMDIRPDAANVERDGTLVIVPPAEVQVGETIVVKPGEKIPLDGIVTEGCSALNTVALTGESLPREVATGSEVASGCINLSGVLRIRTTRSFGESTVTKIIDMVEHASESKSRSESFISHFARIYTPVVVGVAVVLAFVAPLCAESYVESFPEWLYRALIFLIVSCPCALVISVPLSFFGGIGGASRHGILIKGGNFMDTLARMKTVVFDKTGTLTKGVFAVDVVHPNLTSPEDGQPFDARELLHLAAHVEHYSKHPIAQALREAYPDGENDACTVCEVEEVAGHGIRAKVNGRDVCVGNDKMMRSLMPDSDIKAECCAHAAVTVVHVAVDGKYAGHIAISDQVKDDSRDAVRLLKKAGVERTVMLTGDRKEAGQRVANELGLDEWHAELLPDAKVKEVERLLETGSPLAFVGDGINDAPVLKRADIGIAMGGLGSDAAIEAADVVLMDDTPSKIALAIRIARRTITIAKENIWFAISVKVLVLVLAAIGLGNMWMAVFADVGVTVLAVLNAMRSLRVKP